jgi:quinolinate synthase
VDELDVLAACALAEDLGAGDVTAEALRDGGPVVKVPEDVAARARVPIERMVAIA